MEIKVITQVFESAELSLINNLYNKLIKYITIEL